MNDAHTPSTPAPANELQFPRRSPETKVTLDFSGIPAKAQQAISAWLSESDQQAIVDALSAMARKVDKELQENPTDDATFDANQAAEIVVTPSFKTAFNPSNVQTESIQDAA